MMKQITLLTMLTFLFLTFTGCQEKVKSSKSSSSSNSNTAACSGQAYWTTPGCTGYCQYNPSNPACVNGGTTGTATGGSTGGNCTTNIQPTCANYCTVYPGASGCVYYGGAWINCNANPTQTGCPGSSTTVSQTWGVQYPYGVPQGTCSTPYAPSTNPSAFETVKATMTVVGGAWYHPAQASNLLNTSEMLKSVAQAKVLFMTDSTLKVRFNAKAQPSAANTSTVCYGRNTGGSSLPGYTKLKFDLYVYGITNATTNALGPEMYYGNVNVSVNNCTPAIDLSNYKAQYPNGVVIKIANVQSNQNCSPWTSGFYNCNAYKQVRTFECWSLDLEIASDDTKTFN